MTGPEGIEVAAVQAEPRPEFDDLLTQVNPDNVLEVHAALRAQADELEYVLTEAQYTVQIGRCGGDPVSADAEIAFNAKITDMLAVHWAHQREIAEAAGLLRRTALDYGHTDEEIARAITAQDARR